MSFNAGRKSGGLVLDSAPFSWYKEMKCREVKASHTVTQPPGLWASDSTVFFETEFRSQSSPMLTCASITGHSELAGQVFPLSLCDRLASWRSLISHLFSYSPHGRLCAPGWHLRVWGAPWPESLLCMPLKWNICYVACPKSSPQISFGESCCPHLDP